MADPRLLTTFRKPFDEQVAAFRLRLGDLVPTARWDDIERSAHDRSFMVAGAVKADLLADLAAAVDRAIAEGTGLEAFKRDFRAIVEKHGWHGWTGEGTAKGEAWRMRTIYRTNMRVSYQAGRHAQLVAGNYRFWVYRHGGSVEPRLQHLGWNGLILPADHPFWATHYPPNGWGCSCDVSGARSIEGAKRLGGDPAVKLGEGWNAPDPKTGAPKGIGKGWDYAPGASVANVVAAMTGKTVHWPYEIAKAYMADLPAAHVDDFATGYRDQPTLRQELRRYAERALGERNGVPLDKVVVETYRSLGRLTSRQEANYRDLGIEADGYDFALPRDTVLHVLREHGVESVETPRGQRAVVPQDYARLADLLDAPDRVAEDGGRLVFEKTFGGERLIAVFEPRRKRRMLALVTMWVVRGASRH